MKKLLLLLCLIPFSSIKADWNNFIVNYPKNLYGKGSQTWQINSFNNEWVYFANKNGMLQFNGMSWTLFPLKNGLDVRSIHPSANNKRIYVGGINEFGFFEPNSEGKLVYNCLSASMKGKEKLLGNIWNICENENILYFQGDGCILKYYNGIFKYINLKQKIDCSGIINGAIYAGTENGIQVLVGNTFSPLPGSEILKNKRIRGLFQYGNNMLIVTAYNGLFYYDGKTSVKPLPVGVELFMKQNEVFCASLSNGKLALGTVHKGLILIDLKTKAVKYFNENTGMQNNTVLSVSFDGWGNLWAGLDNGIDYILLNSPITNLYSYPYSYGTGYTALLSNNILYLGTNRGLYYTTYPINFGENIPEIKSVPNTSGQVWGLNRIGNDIFCLHDRGVFLLNGASIKRVENITGAWTCQAVMGKTDEIYIGVYDGLFLLKKQSGEWKIVSKIMGLSTSCRYFAQESSRILWIYNTTDLIRVKLNDQLTKVQNVKVYNRSLGMPTDKNAKVTNVQGVICITTSKGVFRYNPTSDRIEHYTLMNHLLNGSMGYCYLTQYDRSIIGLNPENICIADMYRKNAKLNTCIEMSSMELMQGAETIIPISNSLMIIPNENGFALFKTHTGIHKNNYSHMLHIRNVYLTYPKDSLIYIDNFLSRKNKPEILFSKNSIRFEYGVSSFANTEGITYQYRINGKEWSDFTESRMKEYSNLHEGNYTFEVKAVFPNGATSTDSFSFQILPPWYRTNISYICYFILFLLSLWGIYKWDDVRVKRKKSQAVIEKDQEMQQMEQEYEEEKAKKEHQIIELEKEKLEDELNHKNQEMANLMINFVRKNEILTEIKLDLHNVMSSLKNGSATESNQMLLLVGNKIDSNIQGDDVLKKIEDQFDLVHNNFMKKLREKHPDLSNSERLMCAYLKMNLSTKEIAPLLNISVRGVETTRYRLRKKLGLDRDDGLIDYLMSI